MRTISTAGSIRPTKACATRWNSRRPRRKPIIIADTQDNPGAGGDSDTTGMLRALVRNNASRAAIGVIYDPQSRRRPRMPPALAPPSRWRSAASPASPAMRRTRKRFVVEKLSDGKFVAPGPYYGGRDMDMGPSACLRIGDVRVVVSSHKAQLADQAMYRYVGIEPTEQADPGQQELGAFPRRLRADRRKASDLRRARRDAGRHRRPALDAVAPGHPHQAERPRLHAHDQITFNLSATG